MSKEKSIYVVSNSLDWQAIEKALVYDDGRESAAVLLCGVAEGDSERRLLVRLIVHVPTELYRRKINIILRFLLASMIKLLRSVKA